MNKAPVSYSEVTLQESMLLLQSLQAYCSCNWLTLRVKSLAEEHTTGRNVFYFWVHTGREILGWVNKSAFKHWGTRNDSWKNPNCNQDLIKYIEYYVLAFSSFCYNADEETSSLQCDRSLVRRKDYSLKQKLTFSHFLFNTLNDPRSHSGLLT